MSVLARRFHANAKQRATTTRQIVFVAAGKKIIGRDRRARSAENATKNGFARKFQERYVSRQSFTFMWRGVEIYVCRTLDADGYLSLSEISDLNRRVPFIRLCDDDTISALQPDG